MEQTLATRPHRMDFTPLHMALPKVSLYAARLSRLAHHPRLSRMLENAFGVRHLRVTEHHTGRGNAWASRGSIDFSHAKGRARVSFDLSRYPSLAIVTGSGQDHALNDGELALRQAAAALLLAPVIGGLKVLGFDQLRATALRCISSPVTEPVAGIEFEVGDTWMNLEFDEADLAFLCPVEERITGLPASSFSLTPTLAAIRVPGFAILGTQRLRIGTLNSLRAGDVLLKAVAPQFRSLFDPGPGVMPLSLGWGAPGARFLCASGNLEGHLISITDWPYMSNDADVPECSDSRIEDAVDLNELEVPVRLEVDTVVLPLAKLSTLAPGYVIELPVPLTETVVRLVAYGQTVGYGELVAVGENLGLRITRMADGNDSVD